MDNFCIPTILNSASLITMRAKYDNIKPIYDQSIVIILLTRHQVFSLSVGPWLLIAPEFRLYGLLLTLIAL
jgi:hypothetical protein